MSTFLTMEERINVQRLNFLSKKDLNDMEIHTKMICKWVSLFKSALARIEDDPNEERLKNASTPEIDAKIKDTILENFLLTERD